MLSIRSSINTGKIAYKYCHSEWPRSLNYWLPQLFHFISNDVYYIRMLCIRFSEYFYHHDSAIRHWLWFEPKLCKLLFVIYLIFFFKPTLNNSYYYWFSIGCLCSTLSFHFIYFFLFLFIHFVLSFYFRNTFSLVILRVLFSWYKCTFCLH